MRRRRRGRFRLRRDGMRCIWGATARGFTWRGFSATGAQVAGRTIAFDGGAPKLTVHAAEGLGEVDGVAMMEGKPISGGMVLLVPAGYGKVENVSPVERDETNTDGSFTIRGVFPGAVHPGGDRRGLGGELAG